jgi:hypothetical protein
MLMPNLIGYVDRLKLADSAVRLARAAIAIRLRGLREGAYPHPDELPELARMPTSYLHEVPVYEPGFAGGARLALPSTAEGWRRGNPAPAGAQAFRPTPLEYVLPALATKGGARGRESGNGRPPSG